MSPDRKENEPQKNNDPSEAINQPGEVPESNDEKIDQDFPGYPHYPAKEDILNPANNKGRVDLDMENLNRSPNHIRVQKNEEDKLPKFGNDLNEDDDDLGIVAGTEADVTDDDLLLLETQDGDIATEKEEELIATDSISGIDGDELDLPGAELDDANEILGEEDEENNYYSLGADKEDLLENDHE